MIRVLEYMLLAAALWLGIEIATSAYNYGQPPPDGAVVIK